MPTVPRLPLLHFTFTLVCFFGLLQSFALASQSNTENASKATSPISSANTNKEPVRRNPYQYVGQGFAQALNARDSAGAIEWIDQAHFAYIVSKAVFEDANSKMRKDFEQGIRKGMRERTLQAWIHALNQSNGRVDYLRTIQVNGKRRALVRFDYGDAGVNYLELLIDTKREKIYDIFPHTSGELMSDSVIAVSALSFPNSNQLIQRLLGVRQPNKSVLDNYSKVSAAAQKGDFAAAYDALLTLPAELQKSRVISVLRLNYATQIGGEIYDKELDNVARDFGQEPEMGLMLFDYYFGKQQFDLALDAIARLEKRLGKDSVMTVLKSVVYREQGQTERALAAAREAVSLEPEREASHWALVTCLLQQRAFDEVAVALDDVATRFSLSFSPSELAAHEVYAEFARSKAFERWRKQWE